MNKTLILMVGIPGSGKSTFATKLYMRNIKDGHSCEIISRDKIRFALIQNDEDYFAHEDDVWKNYVNQAANSLRANELTILDATHLNGASRKKIINAIKKIYWDKDIELEAVVLDENVLTCLDRNEERIGRAYVPENVIWNMNCQLTVPSKEEKFNKVIFVNWNEEKQDYDWNVEYENE